MATTTPVTLLRFGVFELDLEAGQLLKSGRIVRLQPQPFKLLCLLASSPGRLVPRDEIRSALWTTDTFIDFDQGVNFAVKQVREALGEDGDRPIFVETVPKRGYRFIAPVESVGARAAPVQTPHTDLNLHKVLWTNIAELRLTELRARRRRRVMTIVLAAAALITATMILIRAL